MTLSRACTNNCRTCSKFGVILFLGMVNGMGCHKVTIVPIRDEISVPLLSCWTCSHSPDTPNSECVDMNNKQNMTKTVCQIYQPFCKIRRLEEDGKVERLERSCTQECDPGCNRFQSVKRCESCCTQPLCNVGNDAIARQLDLLTMLVFLAASVYMFK